MYSWWRRKWHILKNCREMKATLHKIRYIHAVVLRTGRTRVNKFSDVCPHSDEASFKIERSSERKGGRQRERETDSDGKPHYKYAQMMWVLFLAKVLALVTGNYLESGWQMERAQASRQASKSYSLHINSVLWYRITIESTIRQYSNNFRKHLHWL